MYGTTCRQLRHQTHFYFNFKLAADILNNFPGS